jgi:hypothetical protein
MVFNLDVLSLPRKTGMMEIQPLSSKTGRFSSSKLEDENRRRNRADLFPRIASGSSHQTRDDTFAAAAALHLEAQDAHITYHTT